MLTLHHLRIGRSLFTVWLLEELELEYTLQVYTRNPDTMRAPPELKQIHPLGKSPVIDDDGLILSEPGAITSYLLEKHDAANRFAPPRVKLRAWAEYSQWLHYPEGSVYTPLLMRMLSLRSGAPQPAIDGFSGPEITLHLDYIRDTLGDHQFILGDLMGDTLSGADFGITYMLSMAGNLGLLEEYPSLQAYVARNRARPAFERALARAVE